MAKMWLIVKFPEEEEVVNVVPCIWFNEKERTCKWPARNCNVGKLIKECVDLKDNYYITPAFQVGKKIYDDYTTATSKCKEAEHTSDLSDRNVSEVSKKSRKTRAVKRIYSDSSEEDETSPTVPNVPFPKLFNNGKNLALRTGDTNGAVATEGAVASSSSCCSLSNSFEEFKNEFKTFETKVFKSFALFKIMMNDLQKQNQEIKDAMPVKAIPRTGVPENLVSMLPLKSLEQLEILESLLEESDSIAAFTDYLKVIGGSCQKNYVKRVLERVLTDEISSEYSWFGFKKKRPFSNLNIKTAIIDAGMQLFPGESLFTLEKAIKDRLAGAKFRICKIKDVSCTEKM